MFEKIWRAGAEGARQIGSLGIITGVGGELLGEVYHAAKLAAAATGISGKTVEEAHEEYQRDFEHVMATTATAYDNSGLRGLGGTGGFLLGTADVLTGNVPK